MEGVAIPTSGWELDKEGQVKIAQASGVRNMGCGVRSQLVKFYFTTGS